MTASLHDLLADRTLDPVRPGDLLALLAAVPLCDDEDAVEAARRRLAEALSAPEIQALAEDLPPAARVGPALPATRRLRAIERLDLARRGARRLGLPDALVGALDRAALAALATVRPGDRALLGTPSPARLHLPDLEPWRTLAAMPLDPATLGALVDDWVRGRVDPADATALANAVATPSPAQDGYREWLADRCQRLRLQRCAPGLSLTEIGGDPRTAPPAWHLPLPHRGPSARLAVHLLREGLAWTEPGAAPRVLPDDVGQLAWGDATTGPMVTTVEVHPAPADLQVLEAARTARVLSGQERPPWPISRDEAHRRALALATDLARGSLCEGVRAATHLVRQDLDGPGDVRAVSCAVQVRAALSVVAGALDDGALHRAVHDADLALAGNDDALLVLSEDQVEDLADGVPPDPETWWGLYTRLAEGPDPARLPGLLRAATRHGPVAAAAPEAPIALAAAPRTDGSPAAPQPVEHPAPWLDAASWASLSPETRASLLVPGRVPLLLLDRASGEGVVAELRVSYSDRGRPWRPDSAILGSAHRALRGAWRAAAALSSDKLPGALFEQHELTVYCPGARGPFELEGDSLGAAALLAFVSLWTETALPKNVATTAAVAGHWLGAVGHVGPKVQALSRHCHGQPVRLLLSLAQPEAREAAAPGVSVEHLESTEALCTAARLDPSLRVAPPDLGSVAARLARLAELADDIEHQRTRRHQVATGIDPWLVMADQVVTIARSLGEVPARDRERVQVALCKAGLAYTHAGAARQVDDVLELVDRMGPRSPVARVLSEIVDLGRKIDADPPDHAAQDALIASLDAALETLRADETSLLRGFVRGTQGRSLMHRHRVAEALPLLSEAVAWHDAEQPHEAGRSRLYLAMAQRMAGQLAAARDTLARALRDIEGPTRDRDPDYAAETLRYWHYERARLAVAEDQPGLALTHTAQALVDAEWRGPWPTAGVLRTRAWALRLLGREAEADTCVAGIEAARARVAAQYASFYERLAAEAGGLPVEGGEVY